MSDTRPADSRISIIDQAVIEEHLGLVLARIEGLEQAALKPADIAAAVGAGMVEAAKNPDTWAAALSGLRKSTEQHAGKWLVGALWAVAKKGLVIVVIGMLIYSFGGWTALSAAWKALWSDQP